MPNYRHRALARTAKLIIGLMAAPPFFPVPAQSQNSHRSRSREHISGLWQAYVTAIASIARRPRESIIRVTGQPTVVILLLDYRLIRFSAGMMRRDL